MQKSRELNKHSITDAISNTGKLIIEPNLIFGKVNSIQFRLQVLQRKYHLSPNLGWDNFHPRKNVTISGHPFNRLALHCDIQSHFKSILFTGTEVCTK